MKKEGKGRYTKSQNVTLKLFYMADTPGPIPQKIGVHVARHDIIKMSNFCNKIFRVFRCIRGHNSDFPIDFAGRHYSSLVA